MFQYFNTPLDEENISEQISIALNSNEVADQCRDIICLQLQIGSLPFTQFCAVYPVPSVPCIHLISPFGEVLSVKSADFTQVQISQWLQETITNFHMNRDMEGKVAEEKLQDQQVSVENAYEKTDEKSQEYQALQTETGKEAKLTQSETIDLPPSSSNNESIPSNPDDIVIESSQENNGEQASQLGLSLEEKIEHAKRLLEEKRKAKAVDEFQKDQEAEIRRRELGCSLTEFKRMQREREIRERLEEQKRERAEREVDRRQILAQIKADRREYMAASAPKSTASDSSSSEKTFVPNPNEECALPWFNVRLQIRLPDGAHMVGVFSAETHLGTDVREYIAARVQGKEISAYNGVTVPPLSEAMRKSFASVVSIGYTFHQTRPSPPRSFSAEDESTKTLLDLGLWPSSILILHGTSTSYSHSTGSVTEYSQNIISYVCGVVWNGIRGAGEAVYYLGYGLINLGQNAWQTLFGAGGDQGGRTVGRAPGGRHPESRSRSSGENSNEGRAYRRQGKISRLSHMPDDTDEQARWNGNSTTQL
ncbi:unnamed protein product [Hymenolepis diminuta]|uniref:UBX domain-containing protein 4 n=1 Tax=Hymenolepis diminuta TaxID=6216 RepID=A0A0R3ST57_HYMDI|nr:unnamed protein product [Hymenolepis diminuta]